MKIILRILIILAAALLVVAATWTLGNSSLMAQLNLEPGRRGNFELREGLTFPARAGRETDAAGLMRERLDGEAEGFPSGERAAFDDHSRREGFERRGGAGFSFLGISSFGQTLIPITATIIAVTFAINLLNRFRRRNRAGTSPSQLTPTEDTTL